MNKKLLLVVSLIMSVGLQVKTFARTAALTSKETEFVKAVLKGEVEDARLLLQQGVNPNIMFNPEAIFPNDRKYEVGGDLKFQTTALLASVGLGNVEMVKMLLKAKVDPNKQNTDLNGTALEMAKNLLDHNNSILKEYSEDDNYHEDHYDKYNLVSSYEEIVKILEDYNKNFRRL